jgi:hypothetical protein
MKPLRANATSTSIGLALLLVGAGCQKIDPTPRQCTLIGCANALVVELDRVPTAPFHLEATQTGTGTRKEYDCASGTCQKSIFFPDFLPPTVDVTIKTSTTTKTQTLTPTYTKSRPNGPGCEPEGTSGRVQVTVP